MSVKHKPIVLFGPAEKKHQKRLLTGKRAGLKLVRISVRVFIDVPSRFRMEMSRKLLRIMR